MYSIYNVSRFSIEKNATLVKIRNVRDNFTENSLASFVEFALYSKLVQSTLFIFNIQLIIVVKRYGYFIIQNRLTSINIKTHKHH